MVKLFDELFTAVAKFLNEAPLQQHLIKSPRARLTAAFIVAAASELACRLQAMYEL